MINKPLSYLVLSDIHLVHPRCSTTEMIEQLDLYFDHYRASSEFVNLDYLFIAGDLFDRHIDGVEGDYHIIQLWLARLLRFCKHYNIKLRLLKGTPSHDKDQMQMAVTLEKILKLEMDFRYIDTLHIEYVKEDNLYILYVPDEYHPESKETYRQVLELMANLGISKVDIAIMHGFFGYQLPELAHSTLKHDEQAYLDIVEHYISIGHVHKFSVYERIIAQGSFGRISHGEEEPKGGTICYITPDGKDSFQFVENIHAKTFKTINIRLRDVEKVLVQIERELSTLEADSYIRLLMNKEHTLYSNLDLVRQRFPMANFTRKDSSKANKTNHLTELDISIEVLYTPIDINKSNIVTLLKEEIDKSHSLSAEQHTMLNEILLDIL